MSDRLDALVGSDGDLHADIDNHLGSKPQFPARWESTLVLVLTFSLHSAAVFPEHPRA